MKGPGWIRITSADTEGGVTLYVEDNGPGVPPEVRARLFEPTCYQRAQAKFDASVAKARAPGACAGNAAAMKQAVIDSVTQLVFETTTDTCVFALDGSHSCLVNPNVPACEAACTLVVGDMTTLPRYDCWCAVGP